MLGSFYKNPLSSALSSLSVYQIVSQIYRIPRTPAPSGCHLHGGVVQQRGGVERGGVVLDQSEPAGEVVAHRVEAQHVVHLTLQRLLTLTHWRAVERS